MKPKFIEHARERMRERGASEEEVKQVLVRGSEIPAKKGRKAKELVLDFGKEWLGKTFRHKKVVVIYVQEDHETVVITVKVLYGEWGVS